MIDGGVALLGGMRRLFAHAELKQVMWRILVLLLVLMLILGAGVFWLTDYLAHLWLPQGDAWYWQLVSWLVWFVAFVLAVMSGVVSFSMLGSVAAAPWLDELAARTESLEGNRTEAPQASWVVLMMRSLVNAVKPMIGLVGFGVLTLILLFIPVVGQLSAAVVWTYAGVRFLNFELMDTTASRRGWHYGARKRELARRRWFYLGFGGTAFVLMMMPILNIMVLPAAVVALSRRL
ncbi:MAG TPA: EI24 domain-containing protein [Mariprofundaceae bacterium]|nr:EI24 domain-containing protein [Mariprofundaceae bacterium]